MPSKSNSLAHYAKGTPSQHEAAPTACKHTVSGTISLPFRGTFHLSPHGTSSLSVAKEYLALRGGPRGFRPGFPCPAVLRSSSRKAARFRLRDCYPLWSGVPAGSTNTQLCNFPTRRQTDPDEPYNPHATTAAAYHIARVWALPLSLATTQGLEVSFLSPVTKMFQFTGLPPPALCIQAGTHAHYRVWVSPFGDPGIKGWSAPPPGLSQPPTSFIGSQRQGIHRVLLFS